MPLFGKDYSKPVATVTTPMNFKEWAKKEEEELRKKQQLKDLLHRGLDSDEFFCLDALFDGQQESQPSVVPSQSPEPERPPARKRSRAVTSSENQKPSKRKKKPPSASDSHRSCCQDHSKWPKSKDTCKVPRLRLFIYLYFYIKIFENQF